jgi:hypothetical protein
MQQSKLNLPNDRAASRPATLSRTLLSRNHNLRPIINSTTYLESILVEVFILNNLNFLRINIFEKQWGGVPVIVNQKYEPTAFPGPRSLRRACERALFPVSY